MANNTNKWKSNTKASLMKRYETRGLSYVASLGRKALEVNTYKDRKGFCSTVHGEICETILHCALLEYIRNNPNRCSQWRIESGLILKDITQPDSRYLTELDLTLFTPKRAYAFECKSYSGNKTLVKECTIQRPSGSFDVFGQHVKHVESLLKNFDSFITKDNLNQQAPCSLYLFDFSRGELTDKRSAKWKAVMPVVNETNVFAIFDDYDRLKPMWNMDFVNKALDVITKNKDKYTNKHLAYVKSLHR